MAVAVETPQRDFAEMGGLGGGRERSGSTLNMMKKKGEFIAKELLLLLLLSRV